jgi:hypothetical protein
MPEASLVNWSLPLAWDSVAETGKATAENNKTDATIDLIITFKLNSILLLCRLSFLFKT